MLIKKDLPETSQARRNVEILRDQLHTVAYERSKGINSYVTEAFYAAMFAHLLEELDRLENLIDGANKTSEDHEIRIEDAETTIAHYVSGG